MVKNAVLVTGCAGFLGSHMVDYLLKNTDYHVVGVDDLSGGSMFNLPKHDRFDFQFGELHVQSWVRLLFERYEFKHIYHFAAYAAENLSSHIPYYNYEQNLMVSVNLMKHAVNQEVQYFSFMSSAAVLGHTPNTPQPNDSYGIAKYAVELELENFKQRYGLSYMAFRGHNIFGERQNLSDKYRNVIGIFINCALNKKPFPIFGDGSQTRQFTYYPDLIEKIAECRVLGTHNIGTDTSVPVIDIAHEVYENFGVPLSERTFETLDARNEVQHVIVDHRYGYPLPDRTQEGIKNMVTWAKGLTDIPEPVNFFNIEIPKGLPKSWR